MAEVPYHCCKCADKEDDREITVALIDAAMNIACSEYSKAGDEDRETALKFLRQYWQRKTPTLEMPRLG